MISYIFSFITFIFMFLNILNIHKENKNMAFIYKIFASISFLLIGVFALIYNQISVSYIFMLIALICGVIGDIVLGLKTIYIKFDNLFLILGIFSFTLGHLFYFLGFYFKYSDNIRLLISLLIGLILSGGNLLIMIKNKFSIEKYKLPIFLYGTIISSTVLYGFMISCYHKLLFISSFGVLNILVSDIILSFVYFSNKKDDLKFQELNHLIYYLGQTLIALSLLFI